METLVHLMLGVFPIWRSQNVKKSSWNSYVCQKSQKKSLCQIGQTIQVLEVERQMDNVDGLSSLSLRAKMEDHLENGEKIHCLKMETQKGGEWNFVHILMNFEILK